MYSSQLPYGNIRLTNDKLNGSHPPITNTYFDKFTSIQIYKLKIFSDTSSLEGKFIKNQVEHD